MDTRAEVTALRVVVESLLKSLTPEDRCRVTAIFEEHARLAGGSRGSALPEVAAQHQKVALDFWRFVLGSPASPG